MWSPQRAVALALRDEPPVLGAIPTIQQHCRCTFARRECWQLSGSFGSAVWFRFSWFGAFVSVRRFLSVIECQRGDGLWGLHLVHRRHRGSSPPCSSALSRAGRQLVASVRRFCFGSAVWFSVTLRRGESCRRLERVPSAASAFVSERLCFDKNSATMDVQLLDEVRPEGAPSGMLE